MYFLFHVVFFSQGFHLLIISSILLHIQKVSADGFFCLVKGSNGFLCTVLHFDEVITELGLHRTDDLADLAVESCILKLFYHLASAKLSQVSALLAGGAGGIFLSSYLEGFGAVLDLFQDLLAFVLAVGEDVFCTDLSALVN